MSNEQIKQIIEALRPLADKFGQGADQFFLLAVKQVYISAVENLLWLVLFSLPLKMLFRLAKNENLDETERVFSGLGIVICFALIIVCVGFLVENIFNPEYQALLNIFHLVIPTK